MTDTALPNLRPTTAPAWRRFRVDLRWQGPPLDPHRLHVAQGLLDLFIGTFRPADDGPPPMAVNATNEDFAATFAMGAAELGQLLHCLGVMRALRIRFVAFGADDATDDFTERLEATPSWTYYPDQEHAARIQAAVGTPKKKTRGNGGW